MDLEKTETKVKAAKNSLSVEDETASIYVDATAERSYGKSIAQLRYTILG